MRPITSPDEQQRIVYNGHKRVHSLKFQSVALPNGLIGNINGLVGMLVSYIIYFLSYHKDLTPDFHNRAGCFLVEIASVLPLFLDSFFFFLITPFLSAQYGG